MGRQGRVGGPPPQGPVPVLVGLMDGNGCSIGTHFLSYKPQIEDCKNEGYRADAMALVLLNMKYEMLNPQVKTCLRCGATGGLQNIGRRHPTCLDFLRQKPLVPPQFDLKTCLRKPNTTSPC